MFESWLDLNDFFCLIPVLATCSWHADRSIPFLIYSGADTRASDNSGTNPFMVAVEKDNLEAVKAMMKKDPGLMSFSVCSQSTVIHWALEEGHQRSAFFKVLCCNLSLLTRFVSIQ